MSLDEGEKDRGWEASRIGLLFLEKVESGA